MTKQTNNGRKHVQPTTDEQPADACERRERDRICHEVQVGTAVYLNQIEPDIVHALSDSLGQEFKQSAMNDVIGMLTDMKPRDPMERMLIMQAFWTHLRVAHLSMMANRQDRLEPMQIAHGYADRASNTFRRLMLALAEYRKPPKAGDSFTAIKQANIATNGGQQVVQNNESAKSQTENTTNEQGSTARQATDENGGPTAQEALSAHPSGQGIPARLNSPHEAVAAVNRPENGKR